MRMNRRALLASGTLSAAGAALSFLTPALSSTLARAQLATPTRRYVFAYFSGGWDTLLSLDPRDPAVFTDGNVSTTQIQPGYDRLPVADRALIAAGGTAFGPFIGGLVDHVENLAVVRGISMETLTHEVGRRRFLTGRAPSGLIARGSSAATWLASQLGASDPVPNLSVNVESYNVDQPAFATALRVASGADLVRVLRPHAPLLDQQAQAYLEATLATAARCRKAQRSAAWQQAEDARQKAQAMVAARLDTMFDIFNTSAEMSALRERHGVRVADGPTSPEAHTAIAAQALTGKVARVVSISPASGLDTHFQTWATDHGPLQRRGFNAIARLAQHLKDTPFDATTSFFDHTIIVGFSEFSRTPVLNAFGGRDHHLTNACFVLGGPVRAGVYGASTDVGMLPQPIALDTGLPDPAGEIVRPEHLLQALFSDAGIADADLRAPPLQLLVS